MNLQELKFMFQEDFNMVWSLQHKMNAHVGVRYNQKHLLSFLRYQELTAEGTWEEELKYKMHVFFNICHCSSIFAAWIFPWES